MFESENMASRLDKIKRQTRSGEEDVLIEAKRILSNDLFSEKKIIQNLRQYSNISELITEEEVSQHLIFSAKEIKLMAVNYRLKFLESKYYKTEIPYEAVLRIKALNTKHSKNLKEFKILSMADAFAGNAPQNGALLFAKTNHGNYYLIHSWGANMPWHHKLKFWPLRNVETMAASLILFTLMVTLALPTHLITLDSKATYWCGYRAGTFFHLLIFFTGFTAYFTITFAKNFSSTNWNKANDFD